MDLLGGRIRKLYFKYLAAACGSAFITSIYELVDMAMVGQYHGFDGTAAMSVVLPIFNIIYSLGLFAGIGGSVLFSTECGKDNLENANAYFTLSLGITAFFSMSSWTAIILFEEPLLQILGAGEELLPLAQQYLRPIELTVPLFVFNQMLAAFLRNDNAPALATVAVLCGGIFNILGDYFFVFALDMGIFGAGFATAMGAGITLIIMLLHFAGNTSALRIVKISDFTLKLKVILMTGFSTFITDLAIGILTMLFNRQIVSYFGTDALAVYGVLVNITLIVQCCAYSAGQAAQPIFSINFGARNWEQIRETLRCALYTVVVFGVLWTVLIIAIPNEIIRIFMKPTKEVLRIAPYIMRSYGISFLLLPLNIFSTYYFQALMKSGAALVVSMGRGILLSGAFIYLLPAVFGADMLWFAMLFTEMAIGGYVIYMIWKYTKELQFQRVA